MTQLNACAEVRLTHPEGECRAFTAAALEAVGEPSLPKRTAQIGTSSVKPPARLERPSQFLSRPGIIPTNMGLTGVVRNTAVQGDGLGRMLGRLLPRRAFAEVGGALAGLTVIAGLYGVFVGLAAVNANRVPKSRIAGCEALKAELAPRKLHGPAVRDATEHANKVIDKTISSNRRQMRESLGLWLTAAGSFVSMITRLASQSAVAAAPVLSVALVSPGLCAFGGVQAANDLAKLRSVNKINRALMQSQVAQSGKPRDNVQQNLQVEKFSQECKAFFKRSQGLLRWASANSMVIAAAGALAPLLSAFTLGLAAPIVGAILGLSTFLRFTVFEPRMDKQAFKPLSVSWADPYRAAAIEDRAHLYDALSQTNDVMENTKKSLVSALHWHERAAIKFAETLGFFPFLSKLPNAAYRRITAGHIKACKAPAANIFYAKLQLKTIADLTKKYEQLLEVRKETLQKDAQHLSTSGVDPYGQSASKLNAQLRSVAADQHKLSELHDAAIKLQKGVARYEAEGSLPNRMDAVAVDLTKLRDDFVAQFKTPKTEESVSKPLHKPQEAQAFLQTMHRLSQSVKALKVDLYHLQAQSVLPS